MTKELVQAIIDSVGTEERQIKNELSRTKGGRSMIEKVDIDSLPLILEALLAVDPDYDTHNNLYISRWDTHLYAVILRGMSEQTVAAFKQKAMELAEMRDREPLDYWQELVNALIN